MQKRKNKRKTLTTIEMFAGILIVILLLLMIHFGPFYQGHKKVRSLVINEVDLSRVNDGHYAGEFNYADFSCEVEIWVKDHRIHMIKVYQNKQNNGYTKKAEGVAEKVMNKQSLKVEAVTGATTSSKALLKSIENALKKGLRK